jgi:DNA-binding IclR family transcriptional regulator
MEYHSILWNIIRDGWRHCTVINSILKALDILALFSAAEPRLSLAEISRRLDMPKSTVHHLLATLMTRSFIERVDNDQYALGTAPIHLAQSARVNVELRDRAAPLLRQLADTGHESTYLTVRDGDELLYMYAIESPRRLLARTAIGEHVPMHCTSNGKAILAHMDVTEVTAIAGRQGLPAFTCNTLTHLPDLLQNLELVRKRGYALDTEEHELKTFCVGVAIFDGSQRVIGACSISGNDPQIIDRRLAEIAPQVQYTAQEISRRMGFVPGAPSQIIDHLAHKERIL